MKILYLFQKHLLSGNDAGMIKLYCSYLDTQNGFKYFYKKDVF